METEKLVIIINGKGGAGKDTLCGFAGEVYETENVSSIDPIKEIASQHGWNGEKNEKSRRFLSELKRLFIEFNNLPNDYLLSEHKKFLLGDKKIMFVHIRESSQIQLFKERVKNTYPNCRCVTLLVNREGDNESEKVGNDSDDGVNDYQYDFYYNNILPIDEARTDFLKFFNNFILNIQR